MHRGNIIRIGLGLGALFLGSLEYIISRPADSSHIGRIVGELAGNILFKIDIFGFLGGFLPDFIHPFSFALLTMAIFPMGDRKTRSIICIFWLFIDILFEIGQFFNRQIAEFITNSFFDNTATSILANYFTKGTYDHLDILAIFLGITAAYTVGEFTAHLIHSPNKPEKIATKSPRHKE